MVCVGLHDGMGGGAGFSLLTLPNEPLSLPHTSLSRPVIHTQPLHCPTCRYRSPDHHAAVRARIVSQLASHPQRYAAYVPQPYQQYVSSMARLGTWGDHVTLQAAGEGDGGRVGRARVWWSCGVFVARAGPGVPPCPDNQFTHEAPSVQPPPFLPPWQINPPHQRTHGASASTW